MNGTSKRFCVLDGLASDRSRDPDEHHVEVLAQACMLESMTHATTGHDQAPNVRSTLRRVQATLGAPRARLLCHAPRAAVPVPPSSRAPAALLLSLSDHQTTRSGRMRSHRAATPHRSAPRRKLWVRCCATRTCCGAFRAAALCAAYWCVCFLARAAQRA